MAYCCRNRVKTLHQLLFIIIFPSNKNNGFGISETGLQTVPMGDAKLFQFQPVSIMLYGIKSKINCAYNLQIQRTVGYIPLTYYNNYIII